ncbi:hypothetical protein, partial [Streptomyces sp. DT18]
KGWRKHGQRVVSLATHAPRGLTTAGGTLLPAAPGTTHATRGLPAGGCGLQDHRRAALEWRRAEGSVIVVGARLATVPGA